MQKCEELGIHHKGVGCTCQEYVKAHQWVHWQILNPHSLVRQAPPIEVGWVQGLKAMKEGV